MHGKKRIVIGEDHTILREGLSALVSSLPDYEVVKEAEDGLEAVQAVDELTPDILLIDLSMPRLNGIEAILETKSRHPDMKIVVLTVHDEEEYILAAYRAGADGYVLKSSPKNELVAALTEVTKGNRFFSSALQTQVSPDASMGKSKGVKSSWENVTSRERQVLKLIAEGHTSKEIADMLSISLKTVGTHRTNLMRKLDLHNVSEVTAYAAKKGLIVSDS